MAHRAMGVEMRAVEAGDAGGLLPAMLEGMETERHERGRRIGSARNPENAALFAQLVVIERIGGQHCGPGGCWRSEEHTSELQSLMRISYAVFCLKKKKSEKHLAIHIQTIR